MREWLPVIGIYIPIFTLQIETVFVLSTGDLSSPAEQVRHPYQNKKRLNERAHSRACALLVEPIAGRLPLIVP